MTTRCSLALIKLDRRLRRQRIFTHQGEEQKWLFPIITHEGTNLLRYILYWYPNIGNQLIFNLLSSNDTNMQLIGGWHIIGRSFQDNTYLSMADALIKDKIEYRRLAADIASQAIGHDEFKHRAERQLMMFFNDPDEEVRAQAADVFRNIDPSDFLRFRRLAEAYLESAAFDEKGSFAFLHAIGEAACDVNDLVIRAAEVVIEDIEKRGNVGGRRHMDLHQLQDLIKREYATSEHESHLRTRLLNVIDKMLKLELYGVEEILKPHER
jgi:hypothetical protein